MSFLSPIHPAGLWGFCSLILTVFAGCSSRKDPGPAGKRQSAVPVITIKAARKDVPLILPAIGTVQPRATVTVRPQVGGKLAEVHFKEGDFVAKGDLLFTIDPRPFEVALAQAAAALEQARAEAANARAREKRYAELGSGSVSAELIEQVRTTALTAATEVTAAEAALERAQLELDYCRIPAPLGGRAGRTLLDPGNIIQANLTDLVVINEIQPIEVSFTLAGRHLPALREFSSGSGPSALEVTVTPEGSSTGSETGSLAFFDNSVRPTTGTIEVRAHFPNQSQILWPGQFADVRLFLTQTKDALTIPSKTIQAGQAGSYVYVVRPDGTAEMRSVEIDRMHENEAIVSAGLKEGEDVVLEGQNLLSPDAKISLQPQEAPPTPQKNPPSPPASAPATKVPDGNSPATAAAVSATPHGSQPSVAP